MALNKNTFRKRTLTAILFVAVMLAGLLWNQWSFFVLFSLIHFGCWIEYQRIIEHIDPGYKEITPFHRYGVMIAGWCLMLYFTSDDLNIFGFRLNELGWWTGLIFLFVLPIMEILFANQVKLKNIGHSAFGLLYISLTLGWMMELYYYPALFIIFTLWVNDTMAYVLGSMIGKTPLSSISPKKTWEGTISGVLLSVALMGLVIIPALLQNEVRSYHWFVLPAIIAITGTFGDLLESKLKRMAGLKDSGTMLPGHGGFLDRFDSMLVAIPFVWLYIQLFY
jgi:phosphatidate cytidylyltransferase